MSTYLKYTAVALAALVLFTSGYRYAAALYGKDMAALREDYAQRALALQEDYRAKEKSRAAALAAAWDQRDKALAESVDLRSDLERVRSEVASARRRLSRSSTGACSAERKKLSEGARLVGELSSALGRCVDLAQRTAADKDAIAALK